MPILETFCNAFKEAITNYEKAMKGKIPVKRQSTVTELRTLLDDFQQEECHRIVLLNRHETIPDKNTFDKSTIYLVPHKRSIDVHWYAHGGTKTVVIADPNKCSQIKAAFKSNRIEKSDSPQSFNDLITLCDYIPRKLDSLAVREEIIGYLKKIAVSPFAFIPLFDSLLRVKLQAVLDHPNFSESRLSIKERQEIAVRQTINENQIKHLTNQVSELVEALKNEQAKDNVQKVNALTLELAHEKETTAFLTQANAQLQQSVDTLYGQCTTLKTENKKLVQEKTSLQSDYNDLKTKYEGLLQGQQSHDETKRHTM